MADRRAVVAFGRVARVACSAGFGVGQSVEWLLCGFPNDGSWPGAPVEHIAAKQTYGKPPILPSAAFSEYWEPPLPARSSRSG